MIRVSDKSRGGSSFVFGLLFLVSVVHFSFSDEVGRGGYAGSFLRMGLGAKALGMGGGSVAFVNDGYTTYYNPAGLVFLEGHWVTTTLNSMALDRRLFYVGYAQSIGKKGREAEKKGLIRGGFSLGWLCAGVDRIDARDFNGNDIGNLSSWENCFYFSFAMNPAPPLSIGFSGKLLYNRFPGITDEGDALSAVGFGFDIGFLVKPVKHVTLGLTVKDLRSKYTWDTQNIYERGTQTVNPFPKIVRGGVALDSLLGYFTCAFDFEKVEYFPVGYALGIQIEGYRGVFLRGGLRRGELTFGMGYRLILGRKFVHMDYGFVPDPVAPRGNHVFTWSFVF